MKSLAILSHKGGVGKTSIAINLAVHLAKEGKNVCLLDNDFNGPSVMTFFKCQVKWINDYLMENEKLDNCLQDMSSTLNLPGKLMVGFADPTAESIQNIIRIDQNSSMKMLHKLMRMKSIIVEDPYSIDYLIIDCSPGTGFSTVNVMVITEAILFVAKLNNADLIGTSQMIAGLHKQLKNRTMILANQIPEKFLNDEDKKKRFQNLIESLLTREIGDKVVIFLDGFPQTLNSKQLNLKPL